MIPGLREVMIPLSPSTTTTSRPSGFRSGRGCRCRRAHRRAVSAGAVLRNADSLRAASNQHTQPDQRARRLVVLACTSPGRPATGEPELPQPGRSVAESSDHRRCAYAPPKADIRRRRATPPPVVYTSQSIPATAAAGSGWGWQVRHTRRAARGPVPAAAAGQRQSNGQCIEHGSAAQSLRAPAEPELNSQSTPQWPECRRSRIWLSTQQPAQTRASVHCTASRVIPGLQCQRARRRSQRGGRHPAATRNALSAGRCKQSRTCGGEDRWMRRGLHLLDRGSTWAWIHS